MDDKVLEVVGKLQKKFGEHSIMVFGDAPADIFGIHAIPSGILDLDYAIGSGGFPRGRVSELYGPEGSGKTTIALHAVAAAQAMGCVAAYVDMEQSLDPELVKAYGVTKDVIICQPAAGEPAIDVVEALVRSGVDLVVVDSVPGLIPVAEASDEMAKNYVGSHARLMSKAMRKLIPAINANVRRRSALLFLNQIRMKVGMPFGDPRVTPGGRALSFYASVRVELAAPNTDDAIWERVEPDPFDEAPSDERDKRRIGHKIRMKVVKNKVGMPYRRAAANLIYGVGIDKVDQVYRVAGHLGLVTQNGPMYRVTGVDKALRGREAVLELLREDDELRASLEAAVRQALVRSAAELGGDAS